MFATIMSIFWIRSQWLVRCRLPHFLPPKCPDVSMCPDLSTDGQTHGGTDTRLIAISPEPYKNDLSLFERVVTLHTLLRYCGKKCYKSQNCSFFPLALVLRPCQDYFTFRADHKSEVGENRSTRRKSTWPSVAELGVSHVTRARREPRNAIYCHFLINPHCGIYEITVEKR